MKFPIFLVTGVVLGVGVVGLLRYEQDHATPPNQALAVPSTSPTVTSSPAVASSNPSEVNAPPSDHLISTIPASGNTEETSPSAAIGFIPALKQVFLAYGLPTSDAQSYGMGLYDLFRQYGEFPPALASDYAMETVLMFQNVHYGVIGGQLFEEAYAATHQGPLKMTPLLNAAASMPSEAVYAAELEIAIHDYQAQGEFFDINHLVTRSMPSARLATMTTNLEHANPAAIAQLFGMTPLVFPSSPTGNATSPSNSQPRIIPSSAS